VSAPAAVRRRARPARVTRPTRAADAARVGSDPLWYKDAVLYEVSVRAFSDSNGDGVGDLPGLIARLGYIEALGADTIWVQPFYPSPLRDDGYDVSDLCDVHPAYGTLDDFRRLVQEAHARGLRIVTEMVLNHTSDRHPWFEAARRASAGSSARERYVWSDRPDRFPEARVLFAGVEASNWAWDPVAGAYYWHRFHAHEPDLNFDHPDVRREIERALDFWFDAGVDGIRVSGVPFLFERDGTSCEDLPESRSYLAELRRHVDARHPGRILLTEANLWPEDAARYAARDERAHLAFLTALAPRLLTALHMEDRHPVADVLGQTPPAAPGSQYALFLRNHDELALEMVTDEERDTMYRAYAADPQARIHAGIRRRLAPLVGNDRRRIELLTGLLFSLPGTPAIYYGDEIGMGDNIYLPGRKGVRTPMQWSAGANAGFSDANPQRLFLPPVTDPEFSYFAVNVAAQEANPRSLLAWTRRLVALRRRFPVFGRGSIEFLHPASRKVLAYVRAHDGVRVLVVANLGRHPQHVELDLSSYRGAVPVELSGRARFPAIGDAPYPLTLSGHSFLWLGLEDAEAAAAAPDGLPRLAVAGPWHSALRGRAATALAEALPAVLASRRWFAGKARAIRDVTLADSVPIPMAGGEEARWTMAVVDYADGEPESYALPLAFAAGEQAGRIREPFAAALVAELEAQGGAGLLYGAERSPAFGRALLDAIASGARFRGHGGEIAAAPTAAFERRRALLRPGDAPKLLSAEQSNSSIRFGSAFILKLFRKTEPGPNPDLEVGAFLTGRAAFPHTPPVCGFIEYRPRNGEPTALAILQGYVANEGDAWTYTLDAVAEFLERAGSSGPAPAVSGSLLALAAGDASVARAHVGPYLDAAALLGRRTAELHRALASDAADPAFAPEPFTGLDQRASYQSLRTLATDSLDLLRRRLGAIPDDARVLGRAILERREAVLARFRRLLDRKLTASRMRIHGDYHLGQVLWTGRDFVIIDFEGEPARPAAIRRAKRSPLKDVAGMLRSYHYAAYQGLATHADTGALPPHRMKAGEAWAAAWHAWVSAAFLRGYLSVARGAPFLPKDQGELDDLLVVHVLEKAIYELAYELNNRPGWVRLPLTGISGLIGGSPS
jgi:maltose alpha-D-glucosyltransferase/alpha-amylase